MNLHKVASTVTLMEVQMKVAEYSQCYQRIYNCGQYTDERRCHFNILLTRTSYFPAKRLSYPPYLFTTQKYQPELYCTVLSK